MASVKEGRLNFEFPSTWDITKYDDWSYYRNQFQESCCGNKAVDILALDSKEGATPTLWLIEIKDYRIASRAKPEPLWDEVAIKVRDTLAGLFAAKMNSSHPDHEFARRSLSAGKLRIILHMEQPVITSKVRKRVFNPADVQQKLRQILKPIDPHALVLEKADMRTAVWKVS